MLYSEAKTHTHTHPEPVKDVKGTARVFHDGVSCCSMLFLVPLTDEQELFWPVTLNVKGFLKFQS